MAEKQLRLGEKVEVTLKLSCTWNSRDDMATVEMPVRGKVTRLTAREPMDARAGYVVTVEFHPSLTEYEQRAPLTIIRRVEGNFESWEVKSLEQDPQEPEPIAAIPY